jgi:Spy/CpxP family protein refolding chaperone
MIKLRNLVAAALLTLCVASLNASAAAAAQNRAGLNPTQPVTGICWIYLGGRWWQVPC